MKENVEIVAMEQLRIGCAQELSDNFDREVQVSVLRQTLCDNITAYFKTFVWVESKNIQEKEVKYPADWWQALKEKWFPKWLLEKYPVEYMHHRLVAKCLYPGFTPAIPDKGFRIAIFEEGYC